MATRKDLRKNPYRGIMTEIAKEEKVSPQAIYNAIKRDRNLRIIEIFDRKIKNIDKRIKKLEAVGLN